MGISDGEVDDALVLIGFHEVINEVSVEEGLGNPCDKRSVVEGLPVVDPIIRLGLPVEQVEDAVEAEEEHVMGCDVFDGLVFGDHV